MGSELERVGYPSERNIDLLWGTRALYEAPELTREVHRRYVRAGADVLTTNTWRIDGIPEGQRRGLIDPDGPSWQEAARLGVALAREAASETGRGEACAVAFSLFLEPVDPAFVPELAEAVAGAEPDLILVETEETIPESLEFPEYAALLATGLPLWVSYRWTAAGPPDLSHIGIGPPRRSAGRGRAVRAGGRALRAHGGLRRPRQLPAAGVRPGHAAAASPPHAPAARRLPEPRDLDQPRLGV